MIPSLARGAPALALVLAACGGSPGAETAPSPAAPRSESAAFVVTIGTDTVAVERYTRTATTLSGEVITRSPRTTSRVYTAQLRPDGSVARAEVTARQLTAAPSAPPTVTTVSFAGDTASVRIVRGDSVQTQRVAAGANAFPLVGGSYAIYEQAIIHARATGGTATRVRMVALGNPQPVNVELRGVAGDSLQLVTQAGPASVRTDATGRILALSAPASTLKVVLQRLPSLDVAALSASFAQREAAGRGLGTLSPRDSVVSTLGGAHIVIDYSRPLRRGRRVLGEVVPLDEVWRTGANAATALRTDRDLTIGGARVPAGAYTLFSLPSASGWQLIINRQTGQWGTEYHAERDLARIPLQSRPASPAVEQFTIRIDPPGTLRMLWDDFELSAPIEVR